jgi:hypothetical protein
MEGEGLQLGEAAHTFVLIDALIVSHPDRAQSVTIPVEVVGGTKYFELKKSDRKVQVLLVGSARDVEVSRPLRNTSIIETLTTLRDDATMSKLQTTRAMWNKRSRRSEGKRLMAKMNAIIGEPTVIQAPGFEGSPAMPMKCLYDALKKPVRLEASVEVLDYLRQVCAWQIVTGDVCNMSYRERIPEDERLHCDVSGISKDYAHRRIRVKKWLGKNKSRTFHFDDSSPSKNALKRALLLKDSPDESGSDRPDAEIEGGLDNSESASDALPSMEQSQHSSADSYGVDVTSPEAGILDIQQL